jgi:hypothetical protein
MDRWCRLVQADEQLSGLLAGLDLADLRTEEEHYVAGLLAAPGGPPPARPGTEVLRRLPAEDRRRLDSYLLQALVEEGVPPTVIMRVGDALAAAASKGQATSHPHDVLTTDAATPRPRKG